MILFTPVMIGHLSVPNRFVRSATAEFMAEDDGTVTPRLVELYQSLAEGEVGLIISGHAYVQPEGKAGPRQTAVYDDRFTPGLRRLAAAVHAFPSRIFLQLAHAGRQTKPKICGCEPVGPSPVIDPSSGVLPRELSEGEIEGLMAAFVQAARRAREAGFDGVELHAAHGYLLSSFISPHTNTRQDGWGGDVVRRGRILVEILQGIKDACGPAFPVIIKLNSTDFLPTGLTLTESIAIAVRLERHGLD
ncbi:MAG: NADH:flavin oxidoreductase, partial [Candidatus Aminicenantes bacterium]|nr:NADH:flavin oxidoreductase [Candidatus Aminicenantes bacterium]